MSTAVHLLEPLDRIGIQRRFKRSLSARAIYGRRGHRVFAVCGVRERHPFCSDKGIYGPMRKIESLLNQTIHFIKYVPNTRAQT